MKIDKVQHKDMTFQSDDSGYKLGQDISGILAETAFERKVAEEFLDPNKTYKKFGTIPDVVCVEIKNKYGIDIHDPIQFADQPTMQKFKRIIKTDYPYLMSYRSK